MTLPKEDFTVRVGPFTYAVKYSKLAATAGDVCGQTQHQELTILIDPSMAKEQQDQTFLHEVTHACCYVSGLSDRIECAKLKEEEIVRQISMTLYQVMNDNPGIFYETP